ncbi:TolC family outer membrane protein [Azonexus sp.]|uniref:TolC family outer membrane protein n=1 Tax=Azonexus sp. TaxID=1872668 RepID=UPI0035AE097A
MSQLKTLPWLLAGLALPLHAQQAATPEVQQALRQVAQQAVQKSPEVTIKWRNYKAAEEEVGVARGGYFPKLDLSAGAGRESLEVPGAAKDSYTRRGYALTLSQMLFDGFATRSEVRKLGKAKLVRYYELLEASENVALEASKAYADVLRYRSLVTLAEDNYVRHKATYEQIKARTASGVGRRVDLDQAASRLALAEVNLTTETANLHDVMARYQRLVGELPAGALTPQQLTGAALPASPKAALDVLYKRNPTLLAAVENIEAAQYDVEGRRAAYMPRVDLRARTETTKNYQGVSGERDQNVAEVVMSWNLFNGGSDTARERQYVERKHMALEMREKACRDTRQTLLIAYNDVQRLRDQKEDLTTQVALLEKTRDAYREQFNIGQRTLLDLLDTENELLAAKRSLVNADTDLTLAYLRSQAGMGSLLEFMGLQKLETTTPEASELAEVDAATLCPPEPVALSGTPRADLDARAQDMLGKKPPVVTPPPPASDADVQARIRAWAQAWSAKDYTAYTAFYAPSFTPDRGLSMKEWDRLRRTRIMPRESIAVTVDKLDVQMHGTDRATAKFEQTYRSNIYNDRVLKTLQMIRENSQWLITGETSVPCRGNTVGGCSPGQR